MKSPNNLVVTLALAYTLSACADQGCNRDESIASGDKINAQTASGDVALRKMCLEEASRGVDDAYAAALPSPPDLERECDQFEKETVYQLVNYFLANISRIKELYIAGTHVAGHNLPEENVFDATVDGLRRDITRLKVRCIDSDNLKEDSGGVTNAYVFGLSAPGSDGTYLDTAGICFSNEFFDDAGPIFNANLGLPPSCVRLGVAAHEMMHLMGERHDRKSGGGDDAIDRFGMEVMLVCVEKRWF